MSAQNLAVENRNQQPWKHAKQGVDAMQLTEAEKDYLIRHLCLYAGREVTAALQVIKHDRTKAGALDAADVASGHATTGRPPSQSSPARA